jgi:hypothetical protein
MLNLLNSILIAVQRNVGDFIDWWFSINYTYRGGGCLLAALLLMCEATRASREGERDRRFFITGMAALGLLAYAAMQFSNGDTPMSN